MNKIYPSRITKAYRMLRALFRITHVNAYHCITRSPNHDSNETFLKRVILPNIIAKRKRNIMGMMKPDLLFMITLTKLNKHPRFKNNDNNYIVNKIINLLRS